MAIGNRRKYNLAIEQVEREYAEANFGKASQEKIQRMSEAQILFVMAQRHLYGENPDWNKMTIEEKAPFGWLRPQYIFLETTMTGRWDYWISFRAHCKAGSGEKFIEGREIPQMQFLSTGQGNNIAKEMLLLCLQDAPGAYAHSRYEMFEMFIDWLLYSFGCSEVKELPKRITKEMQGFWYKEFKPQLLLIYPDDYLGELASTEKVAKNSAYFPTPMNIVDVMTRMTMEHNEATKYSTVNDPCLGSGRMLLHASNYSLRLYGQDINKMIHKVSLVNGYLYMPWAVEIDDDTNNVLNKLAEKYNKVVKRNEENTGS